MEHRDQSVPALPVAILPVAILPVAMLLVAILLAAVPGVAAAAGDEICSERQGSRAQASAAVRPAVVTIQLVTPGGQPAHGAGFVWDHSGLIVTNHHVIGAGSRPVVQFVSGEVRTATVVADRPDRDISVISVAGPVPPPVELGRNQRLRRGQPVLTIGNPFGRGLTVAAGRITALDDQIMIPPGIALSGMIRTDVPFEPGNSGGPLFDCRGRVIGMAAAVHPDPDRTGIAGYAIPIDRLVAVTRDAARNRKLIERAAHRKPRPGVGLMVIAAEGGLTVTGVLPGSPAQAAGIVPGDHLTLANHEPVASAPELAQQINRIGIGGTVELTVVRDDATLPLQVPVKGFDFGALGPPH